MGVLCYERCEEDIRGGRLEEEDRRQRYLDAILTFKMAVLNVYTPVYLRIYL